jgi:hypothetical protein
VDISVINLFDYCVNLEVDHFSTSKVDSQLVAGDLVSDLQVESFLIAFHNGLEHIVDHMSRRVHPTLLIF